MASEPACETAILSKYCNTSLLGQLPQLQKAELMMPSRISSYQIPQAQWGHDPNILSTVQGFFYHIGIARLAGV